MGKLFVIEGIDGSGKATQSALLQQALHMLPLFVLTQVLMVAVRLLAGAEFPGWSYFLSSLSNALLWAPLSILLMLPQYQPVDRDDNRPI